MRDAATFSIQVEQVRQSINGPEPSLFRDM